MNQTTIFQARRVRTCDAPAPSCSLVSAEWRGTAEGRGEMEITRELIAVRERRASRVGVTGAPEPTLVGQIDA